MLGLLSVLEIPTLWRRYLLLVNTKELKQQGSQSSSRDLVKQLGHIVDKEVFRWHS